MIRILIPILAFLSSPPAFAESCREMPVREMWENIRVLPPVEIPYYDGVKIEYVINAKEGVSVGSLAVDAFTDIPEGFGKTYRKKTWWVIYCAADSTVVFIQDFDLGKQFLDAQKKRKRK